jgi:hypothetical protein
LTEGQMVEPVISTGATSSPMVQDVSSSGAIVDGEVLVRNGETITREHADRAESAGVLAQLVASAGGSSLSGLGERAQSTGAGLQDKAEQAAIGKMAGTYVEAEDGSILVAPGQMITEATMERARIHGKEKAVIASVAAGETKARVQTGVATAREAAGGFMETVREKFHDLTGAASERKADYDAKREQDAINNALGRPVTRVILAPDDTVILNTGDLVTHRAVEHARSEGVLEMILDSVSTAEPDITPEMLRARDSGTDALPSQQQPTGGPITATIAPDASS